MIRTARALRSCWCWLCRRFCCSSYRSPYYVGAYIAGLFFEEKVANKKLYDLVNDRLYGLSYSFLGPIFFISLGFNITFNLSANSIWIAGDLDANGVDWPDCQRRLDGKAHAFYWLESLNYWCRHVWKGWKWPLFWHPWA